MNKKERDLAISILEEMNHGPLSEESRHTVERWKKEERRKDMFLTGLLMGVCSAVLALVIKAALFGVTVMIEALAGFVERALL